MKKLAQLVASIIIMSVSFVFIYMGLCYNSPPVFNLLIVSMGYVLLGIGVMLIIDHIKMLK